MPSSSRRKQSKPQHLTYDDGGKETGNNETATSTLGSTGDQPAQEIRYKLKVFEESKEDTSGLTNGYRPLGYDDESDDDSLIDGDAENHKLEELVPEDLSSKVKVSQNDLDLEQSITNNSDVHPLLTDTYGLTDYSANIKENHEQHFYKHSKEDSIQCHICCVTFKSKDVLQHHLVSSHDISTGKVNIAQQNSNRKRPLDEDSRSIYSNRKRPLDEDSRSIYSTSPASQDTSSENSDLNADKDIEMASKRYRDKHYSPQNQYASAMPPHLTPVKETSYEGHMRAYEASLKFPASEMVDPHVCQVCSKMFPKPSDLKRHMMCHTGEKPFRCEYCNKPFRAKSSMHYHLKATHGVDIELSPGLEERYLRMKTRAQMNLLQRGHLTGLPQIYGSESGNYRRENVDLDDFDDDAKSTDSFCQSVSVGADLASETISQGINGQTGNESKAALDLSKSGRNNLIGSAVQSTSNGDEIDNNEAPFKRNRLSVQNETILVTRLDGHDIVRGENSSVFKCYLCSEMLPSLSKMQNHLSVHYHKSNINYQCCFCDEAFQQKAYMQDHMRRKHSSDVSGLCNVEESSFMYDNQSNEDGSFSCRFCLKKYDDMISLHKHARLHTWNKKFCCKICGKLFSQYTSLQIHISRLHWKTVGKSKLRSSWVRSRRHLMNIWRLPPKLRSDLPKTAWEEPLNLIHQSKNQNTSVLPNQSVTIVMPRSPSTADGSISDVADTGFSQHSSDNNCSEAMSDNPLLDTDSGDVEIRTAPKRSLLPFKHDMSPRGRSARKSTPAHLSYQNHATSDNELPLNFSKSDRSPQDTNNNEASNGTQNGLSPELHLPITASNPEAIMPGYALGSTNHLLMAKALAAHQSLTHHLNNTSQPMIFPPNHLPPSLAAMNQMMSLPVSTALMPDQHAGTSKSPSPASHSSSKSDTSPEDRDSKDGIRESILGYPRFPLGQEKTAGSLWSFNMYSPPDTSHTDGRKVTSLSRTHSRLGIVQSPINREAMCKATTLTDGRTVYKCPFCSKEFVSYSDINRHMDFHEDIRPYKCHYCDYYARTNSQLKVHMMRHQGIREFCCKLCNYKGVTQSDLNRHMKSQIHMLKSRNACTYCGEGFVTTKNLEKHLDGNCIVKMQKLQGGLDLPIQERVA